MKLWLATLQVCNKHSITAIMGLLKNVSLHSDINNNKMAIPTKEFFSLSYHSLMLCVLFIYYKFKSSLDEQVCWLGSIIVTV
jgi:hypothetical protein